jgi:hypothetical protein
MRLLRPAGSPDPLALAESRWPLALANPAQPCLGRLGWLLVLAIAPGTARALGVLLDAAIGTNHEPIIPPPSRRLRQGHGWRRPTTRAEFSAADRDQRPWARIW